MTTLPRNTLPAMTDEFRCPICGSELAFEGIDEMTQDAEGRWYASHVEFGCATEPDIDKDEWWSWHRHHYRTPYVDWLPLQDRILAWLKRAYRFEESANA